MSPLKMIELLEEILALYSELKKDGTLDKLIAAEQAVMHEVETNAHLKDLQAKLSLLSAHAAPVPAPVHK